MFVSELLGQFGTSFGWCRNRGFALSDLGFDSLSPFLVCVADFIREAGHGRQQADSQQDFDSLHSVTLLLLECSHSG